MPLLIAIHPTGTEYPAAEALHMQRTNWAALMRLAREWKAKGDPERAARMVGYARESSRRAQDMQRRIRQEAHQCPLF